HRATGVRTRVSLERQGDGWLTLMQVREILGVCGGGVVMQHGIGMYSSRVSLVACMVLGWPFAAAQNGKPAIPRTWDEAAIGDWATPIAGLHGRPTHITPEEYYSFPVENLRTYPVYYPGREPAGYWEMLQHVGPKPLIELARLKTEADWIDAGRRVFDELDIIG